MELKKNDQLYSINTAIKGYSFTFDQYGNKIGGALQTLSDGISNVLDNIVTDNWDDDVKDNVNETKTDIVTETNNSKLTADYIVAGQGPIETLKQLVTKYVTEYEKYENKKNNPEYISEEDPNDKDKTITVLDPQYVKLLDVYVKAIGELEEECLEILKKVKEYFESYDFTTHTGTIDPSTITSDFDYDRIFKDYLEEYGLQAPADEGPKEEEPKEEEPKEEEPKGAKSKEEVIEKLKRKGCSEEEAAELYENYIRRYNNRNNEIANLMEQKGLTADEAARYVDQMIEDELLTPKEREFYEAVARFDFGKKYNDWLGPAHKYEDVFYTEDTYDELCSKLKNSTVEQDKNFYALQALIKIEQELRDGTLSVEEANNLASKLYIAGGSAIQGDTGLHGVYDALFGDKAESDFDNQVKRFKNNPKWIEGYTFTALYEVDKVSYDDLKNSISYWASQDATGSADEHEDSINFYAMKAFIKIEKDVRNGSLSLADAKALAQEIGSMCEYNGDNYINKDTALHDAYNALMSIMDDNTVLLQYSTSTQT